MGRRREYIAKVTSDKMDKTRTVEVVQMGKHPKYGRVMKKYNKFKVHDEKNQAKVADTVLIRETRPLSKDKRYILVKVIKEAVNSAQIKQEEVELAKIKPAKKERVEVPAQEQNEEKT